MVMFLCVMAVLMLRDLAKRLDRIECGGGGSAPHPVEPMDETIEEYVARLEGGER